MAELTGYIIIATATVLSLSLLLALLAVSRWVADRWERHVQDEMRLTVEQRAALRVLRRIHEEQPK